MFYPSVFEDWRIESITIAYFVTINLPFAQLLNLYYFAPQ